MTIDRNKMKESENLGKEIKKAIKNANYNELKGLLENLGSEKISEHIRSIIIDTLKYKVNLAWEENLASIDEALNILKLLQTYGVDINLSTIANETFYHLILERPEYALEILNKTPDKEFNIDIDALRTIVKDYIQIGALPVHGPALVDCINLLLDKLALSNNNLKLNKVKLLLIELLQPILLKIDYPYILSLGFEKDNSQLLETYFNYIIQWDSSKALSHFLGMFSGLDIPKMLKQAVQMRAAKCVSVLLEIRHIALNQHLIDEQAKITAYNADGATLLALFKSDYKAVANFIFGQEFFVDMKLHSDQELKNYILSLLRFTPIEMIDAIVDHYEHDLISRTRLLHVYQEAKSNFFTVAPCFSRSKNLEELAKAYGNNKIGDDITKSTLADMDYGAKRYLFANQLLALVENSQVQPQSAEFHALPASSSNTRRAAYLLEAIANWLYDNQKMTDKNTDFKTLRVKNNFYTPVSGRYTWATPLISNIIFFSQSTDVRKSMSTYQLKYHDTVLNSITDEMIVLRGEKVKCRVWNHGAAPLTSTWTEIENLFEKLWLFDFKQLSTASEHQLENETKFTEFYVIMAELVWLIGNSQPLNRGSGSFAELIMVIIHLHHHLLPPILKLDFPQLDVLDITFPLSDYKKIFTYFFEPSTVPAHLKKTAVSSESVFTQLRQWYAGLNNNSLNDQQLNDKNVTNAYPTANEYTLFSSSTKKTTVPNNINAENDNSSNKL